MRIFRKKEASTKLFPGHKHPPPPPDTSWRVEFKEKISVMSDDEFLEEYNKQIGHPKPTEKDDWKLQYMIQICMNKAMQP